MLRRPRQILLATVIASLTVGAASAASAAPVTGAIRGADVQASAAHPMVQKAYWVWRHHHRYWVHPHHHD